MIVEETFTRNKVFVGTYFPWFCPASPLPQALLFYCHGIFLLTAHCFPSSSSPGGNFTPSDLADCMYPHYKDQSSYRVLDNSLFQAYSVVSSTEISKPKHLDVNDQPCLIVVKNGSATGTHWGRGVIYPVGTL